MKNQKSSHEVSVKMKLISESIRECMKERGISKLEFSKMKNVQPSIITRWLSGKHNFTVETIFKIEEKIGMFVIIIA